MNEKDYQEYQEFLRYKKMKQETERAAPVLTTNAAAPTGYTVNNFWYWCLGFFPLICRFRPLLQMRSSVQELIAIGLCGLLWLFDFLAISHSDYDGKMGWTATALLLMPLYMFIRGTEINRQYAPAIIQSVLLVFAILYFACGFDVILWLVSMFH